MFNVLAGKISWIGYIPREQSKGNLPDLKQGILNPGDLFTEFTLNEEKITRLNILYAKDYSLSTDSEIMLKAWKNLDKNPQ
jgi:hypothetical protein